MIQCRLHLPLRPNARCLLMPRPMVFAGHRDAAYSQRLICKAFQLAFPYFSSCEDSLSSRYHGHLKSLLFGLLIARLPVSGIGCERRPPLAWSRQLRVVIRDPRVIGLRYTLYHLHGIFPT